jgi:hypothetical protein
MLNGNERDGGAEPFARRAQQRTHAGRAALYALGIAAVGVALSTGLIRCPVATMFHAPCPGCGTTRAALALLALDPMTALRFNPVAPLVLAALAGLAWRAIALAYTEGDARRLDQEKLGRFFIRVFLVATVVEIVVWVLRFFGLFGGPCPV